MSAGVVSTPKFGIVWFVAYSDCWNFSAENIRSLTSEGAAVVVYYRIEIRGGEGMDEGLYKTALSMF